MIIINLLPVTGDFLTRGWGQEKIGKFKFLPICLDNLFLQTLECFDHLEVDSSLKKKYYVYGKSSIWTVLTVFIKSGLHWRYNIQHYLSEERAWFIIILVYISKQIQKLRKNNFGQPFNLYNYKKYTLAKRAPDFLL